MQIQKDYIRKAILDSAKDEFLEKGYRKASIRAIASRADVTLSNIYNYFKDKDEIFREIMMPILDAIKEGQRRIEHMERDEKSFSEEEHVRMLDKPAEFIYNNREMFNLLLYRSEGSSLADLPEEMTKWNARIMRLSVEWASERHHVQIDAPSEYMLHYIGSAWIHLAMDSVRYNYPLETMKENAKQLMRFVLHGWIGMLGVPHH